MRHRFSWVIPLAAGILLAGCGNAGPADSGPESSSASSAHAHGAQQELREGDSFEVPCGFLDDKDPASCMTVKIKHIDPVAECDSFGEDPEAPRHVRLDLEASMPDDVPQDFHSPFGSLPWSVSTTDKKISRIQAPDACRGDTSENIKGNFAGYTADAVVYLPVPTDAALIHIESTLHEEIATIDVQAPDGATASERTQEDSGDDDAASENHSEPGAAGAAESDGDTGDAGSADSAADDDAPAPEAGADEEPVIGYTEAPGQVAPHPLDKSIASCGDPGMHERGTTFFTDGTSGWTQTCSDQMGG